MIDSAFCARCLGLGVDASVVSLEWRLVLSLSLSRGFGLIVNGDVGVGLLVGT